LTFNKRTRQSALAAVRCFRFTRFRAWLMDSSQLALSIAALGFAANLPKRVASFVPSFPCR
jgi:hypothetical protein